MLVISLESTITNLIYGILVVRDLANSLPRVYTDLCVCRCSFLSCYLSRHGFPLQLLLFVLRYIDGAGSNALQVFVAHILQEWERS